MARQRAAHALRAEGSAAQGDHASVGALEHRGGQRLLPDTELGLAAPLEEVGDGRPQLPLQKRVDVHRLGSQARGGLAGGGRLARAHEPDEHQRRR